MAGPVIPAQRPRLTLRDLAGGVGEMLGFPARPVTVMPPAPRPGERPNWQQFRDPETWQRHPLAIAARAWGEVSKDPGAQAFDIGGGGLELPGAFTAMAIGRMSPQHFFQMRLTSLLAEGVPESDAVAQLMAKVPLSAKRVATAIEGAKKNLARIMEDSGGAIVDPAHYREGIKASLHMRQWYEEAVPMVQAEIPRRGGEKLIDGLTLRQWRGLKVLAHFGTNTPPKGNYEQFKKVVPYINTTRSNKELLAKGTTFVPEQVTDEATGKVQTIQQKYLFGMKASTPGMPGLEKTLLAKEGPNAFETGGRKIESYYYNLAQKKRDAFGEVVKPVTADRWMFRFVRLPFEEGGVYASTSNSLASAAYDMIERFTTRAAQELGIQPEEAQAAAWFTEKLTDSFRTAEVMEQGYPFFQQKVLNETLAKVPEQSIKDMAKSLYDSLMATGGEGGTVSTTGKNMFGQPATAVGVYPERTRLFPVPMDFRSPLTKKNTEQWEKVTGGLPSAYLSRSRKEIADLRDKQLPKFENFIRDNADVFFTTEGKPRGDLVGAGGWLAPAGSIQIAGTPNAAKTLTLDPTLLPKLGRPQGVQGEVAGALADQAGVFHLQEVARGQTAAPQSYVSTFGTGGANAQLPPLYDRLALARPRALPSLVGQLAESTAKSSPREELLQNILARLEDAGLLSQFGSRRRSPVLYDWRR